MWTSLSCLLFPYISHLYPIDSPLPSWKHVARILPLSCLKYSKNRENKLCWVKSFPVLNAKNNGWDFIRVHHSMRGGKTQVCELKMSSIFNWEWVTPEEVATLWGKVSCVTGGGGSIHQEPVQQGDLKKLLEVCKNYQYISDKGKEISPLDHGHSRAWDVRVGLRCRFQKIKR